MKGKGVLVLGCGLFGERVAKELAGSGNFTQFVLADINRELVDKLVVKLRSLAGEVRGEIVDGSNEDAVRQLLKGIDVLVNVTGADAITALPAARAAIHCGIGYVDINADVAATQSAIKLDDEAKRAGTAILIGFGDFPGIANFFARKGADSMDQAEEITIATTARMRTRIGTAAMSRVWQNTFAGTAIVWQDGQLIEVEARGGKEIIELPDGGSYEVMLARLSQAVTLPRHISGLKRVVCKAGLGSKEIGNDILCALFNWGMNSTESIDVKGVKVAPADFAVAFLESDAHYQAVGMGRDITTGGNMICVTGLKNGKPASYVCSYIDAGMRNTERTCALAANMIARGLIQQAGVLAPEALEPEPFIKHALQAGTVVREVISQYI